jgi:hypothetical protein
MHATVVIVNMCDYEQAQPIYDQYMWINLRHFQSLFEL